MTLTIRDVARILRVSEKTVHRWVHQGGLPASKVEDEYRINRAELLEWATDRKLSVPAEIFGEVEKAPTAMPRLAGALEAGGVLDHLAGQDKESVLRSLVGAMRLPEEVDRQLLFEVLLAREALGSTGIGDGFAIPHIRNPIVLHVAQPMITLGFLDQPVDFGALDGRPVHTLFALVSPTVRAHLHLLSRLSFALRDVAFREVVARRGSRNEILLAAQRFDSEFGSSATEKPSTGP